MVEILLIHRISALDQVLSEGRKWEDVEHRVVRGRNLLPCRPYVLFESLEDALSRPHYAIRPRAIKRIAARSEKGGYSIAATEHVFRDSDMQTVGQYSLYYADALDSEIVSIGIGRKQTWAGLQHL